MCYRALCDAAEVKAQRLPHAERGSVAKSSYHVLFTGSKWMFLTHSLPAQAPSQHPSSGLGSAVP